jgi:hypothetical protein
VGEPVTLAIPRVQSLRHLIFPRQLKVLRELTVVVGRPERMRRSQDSFEPFPRDHRLLLQRSTRPLLLNMAHENVMGSTKLRDARR